MLGLSAQIGSKGGELVKTEPKNIDLVRKDAKVWKIMYEGGLKELMEACNGFDPSLSFEVTKSWDNGRCKVN